jgi:autotransporter passenger strand-loop-strand repeat protein
MGTITVSAGVTSRFLTLTNGQEALIYGSALNTTIARGGAQIIRAGGLAVAATVSSGGEEFVAAGGTDSATEILSGGTAYVYGSAAGPAVYSAGTLYLYSGDTYNMALQGEAMIAGGATSRTTVDSGGSEYVTGGTVSLTAISSGGAEILLSGGSAYGTVVKDGGVLSAFAGGAADNIIVSNGGTAELGSGGSVYGMTVLHGGTAYIAAGAAANFITIASGGLAEVFPQAADYATIIAAGGVETIAPGGTSTSASIHSGGALFLLPGAAAIAPSIAADGFLVVLPGATTTDVTGANTSTGVITENPKTAALFTAVATGAAVLPGGTQFVLQGGTAIATTLAGDASAFATAEIFSAGALNSMIIESAGAAYVLSGGTASATTVNSGGYLYLSGGTAAATQLNAGAFMQLSDTATAISTTIEGGARQLVAPSASTSLTTVAAGAVQILSGGTAHATTVSSGGNQYIDAGSTAAASTILGTQIVSQNAVTDNPNIAGGTLVLSIGSSLTGAADFSAPGGTLVFDSPTLPTAVLQNFTSGDAIDLNALPYNPADTLSIIAPGTLAIAPAGQLSIAGALSAADFYIADNNGETELLTDRIPCFASGTRILTPRGEIAIEDLEIGDQVITGTGADAPIIWLGRRRIQLATHKNPSTVQPIRIAAHSFGPGQPARDLLLSPDHAVYVAGVLMPAKVLSNHANITQLRREAITYYHLELPEHAIIFAENLAVESFLDTGNRACFTPSAGRDVPTGAVQSRRAENSCAPLVETGHLVATLRFEAARRHV